MVSCGSYHDCTVEGLHQELLDFSGLEYFINRQSAVFPILRDLSPEEMEKWRRDRCAAEGQMVHNSTVFTEEDTIRAILPPECFLEKFRFDNPRDQKRLLGVVSLHPTGVVGFNQNGSLIFFDRVTASTVGVRCSSSVHSAHEDVLFADPHFDFCYFFFSLRGYKYIQVGRSDKWVLQSSGGTPIPVRLPILSTAESWSVNPQFHLRIDGVPQQVALYIQLSQSLESDPCEILLSVFKGANKMRSFDKSCIVQDGISFLRKGKSVQINTVVPPGDYIIVPSTWEFPITKNFRLSAWLRSINGASISVKIQRL